MSLGKLIWRLGKEDNSKDSRYVEAITPFIIPSNFNPSHQIHYLGFLEKSNSMCFSKKALKL